jgi:hypothetical protein
MNPHGISPWKFALRKEKKEKAIYYNSSFCVVFSGGLDTAYNVLVENDSDTNRNSYTANDICYGSRIYMNDSTFEYFFMGVEDFPVKEIEVFEITN